ncbi:MAG: hypothetical protein E7632_09330 [Ruminococcaceae bacterium]|nr:hypothetical protein [Oscillospiraceae bacterium]
MYLDFEMVRSITRGAAYVTEEDGFFRFHRYTPSQEQVGLAVRGSGYHLQMQATAGVRLAFFTDSDTLAFDYAITTIETVYKKASIDVRVNDVLMGHYSGEGDELTGHFAVSLTDGTTAKKKRVEVYLPYAMSAALAHITLDDGASVTPAFRSRRMVQYGDSITHGYYAEFPSMAYSSLIAKYCGADAYNHGIGGDQFFPELVDAEEAFEPDIVTVAYGTNDWVCHDRAHISEKCTEFFRKLSKKHPSAHIFAISPIWRGNFDIQTPYGEPVYAVDALIRECTAGLANVHPVNGWELVGHEYAFFGDDVAVHPNDLGFGEYAAKLYEIIKPYLED